MKPTPHPDQAIQAVIFSRDRAMQLDGVLRSFYLHCQDASQARLSVLFLASDERHDRQYHTLAAEYNGRVHFIRQRDFRRDLLSILAPFQRGRQESLYWRLSKIGGLGFPLGSFPNRLWRRTLGPLPALLARLFLSAWGRDAYVLFLVDDNIFVRDFRLQEVVETLEGHPDLIGFSLRLGENTTYCYSHGRPQALPPFASIKPHIVKYPWSQADGDFGYPLEISSSVYRSRDILPLVMGLPFHNPNSLEGRLAFQAKDFRAGRPRLGCYRSSVTFCNPVNIVQTMTPNRAGEKSGYMADELRLLFEQGQRIHVDEYAGFTSSACHQEVELVFEQGRAVP